MKNYLACLLLLAPGLSLAQTPAPTTYPYVIRGKIGQLNAPAKVYLQCNEFTESVTLKQGQFELKGTTHFPQSATLILERQGNLQSGWREEKMPDGKTGKTYVESPDRLRIFLEPGPIVVASADSLRNARVTGSPLTADLKRLDKHMEPAAAKLKAANSQEFTALAKEYVQAYYAFVKANPTSWVSLEALQYARQMGSPEYADVAPLYANFTPAQKASPIGKFYGELLAGLKNSALGSLAPAFTQQTPDGKSVSLADYRGKYVLVDFWASWCTPCRAENPAVLKAYQAFKDRNFEVLGVSLDNEETRFAWVRAIADDHMSWTQVSDLRGFGSAVAQQYGVKSIPQNFLVDPSGKIVASNLRGAELEATLAKFIK